MTLRFIGSTLFALALSAAAHAEVVIVQTTPAPGVYTTVQAGIDAAQSGDVVLVRVNTSASFFETPVIDGKGISLMGDFDASAVYIRSLTVRNVPVGQSVLVRNVDIGTGVAWPPGVALRVENCDGSIRFVDVRAEGADGQPGVQGGSPPRDAWDGIVVQNCADVAFSRCVLWGGPGGNLDSALTDIEATNGGRGLVIVDSTVTAMDSSVAGGMGGGVNTFVDVAPGLGGIGLLNDGGQLMLYGGVVRGGHGGDAGCGPLSGCLQGADGATAFVQQGVGAHTWLRDPTITGGHGGDGGGAEPNGNHGALQDVQAGTTAEFPAMARRMLLDSPVRESQEIQLMLQADMGDRVFLLFSLGNSQAVLPAYQGPFLLGPLLLPDLLYVGNVDSPGFDSFALGPAPDLPLGVDALELHVQVVTETMGNYTLAPFEDLTIVSAAF